MPKRKPSLQLSLFDPLKRFGVRRRHAKPGAMPRIRVLGGDDPIVPLFRRPEPPPPPAPTPDDPLDATRIHCRLEAIGRALEDLPGQALRMARWKARREARWQRERATERADQLLVQNTPSPSRASPSPPLPHIRGGEEPRFCSGAPAGDFLAPTQWGRGGEPEGRDGEGVATELGGNAARRDDKAGETGRAGSGTAWQDLGISPEVLAMCRRRQERAAQGNINPTPPQPKRRFYRLSPMRAGRPPGFRKKPTHEVHHLLNELHGLAVWASERRLVMTAVET
jgi:hypothetical protein